MQKHYGKIMTVLVLGSIWGVMEIFGVELLKAMAVPHKSPFLFAFALVIMMASKRLSDFRGSAIVLAIIAALYKTMSFSLPACGSNVFAAVIIDGVVFEAGYQIARDRIESGLWQRSLLGISAAFGAFLAFGLYATLVNPEGAASSGNFTNVLSYLKASGAYAVAFAAVAVNIGYYLGDSIKAAMSPESSARTASLYKVSGLLMLVAAWAARLAASV